LSKAGAKVRRKVESGKAEWPKMAIVKQN